MKTFRLFALLASPLLALWGCGGGGGGAANEAPVQQAREAGQGAGAAADSAFGQQAQDTKKGSAVADAAAGKRLYDAKCAVCHGPNGEGGRVGDEEADALMGDGLAWGYRRDRKLINRAIFEGLNEYGHTMDAVMPRYKGKLSDAEVENIIAYLQPAK